MKHVLKKVKKKKLLGKRFEYIDNVQMRKTGLGNVTDEIISHLLPKSATLLCYIYIQWNVTNWIFPKV